MATTITPQVGNAPELARMLLALAEDPNQVRTVTDGPLGLAFEVPDELHERYLAITAPTQDEDEPDDSVDSTAPKRRGRPRKATSQEEAS